MPYMTKDGETILVDDGAVAYWLGEGWEPDANQDQVADGSPVGATETAYFIADTTNFTADGTGGEVNWKADPDHGALPSWVSVDGDKNIALDVSAGTCACAAILAADFDFSGTTPPDAGDNVSTGCQVKVDGNSIANPQDDGVAGDEQDEQSVTAPPAGGLVVGSLVTVETFPYAGSGSTDGTVSIRAALTITRIAQAPVLPEA